jgi:hypothetical protein
MIVIGWVVDTIRRRDRHTPLDDLERDPHVGGAVGLTREMQRGLLDYPSGAAAQTAPSPSFWSYSETH